MQKERYEVIDSQTGHTMPISTFLLQRLKDNIVQEVLRQLEQTRQQALQPNFLKGMVTKGPGNNAGNGNKKRG